MEESVIYSGLKQKLKDKITMANSMEFISKTILKISSDKINLKEWLYGMIDEEYQRCSKNHLGMGSYIRDGKRGLVNVESIGGTLMIQHYKEVESRANYVCVKSNQTRAYIFHLILVSGSVTWEMKISPLSQNECEFECRVKVEIQNRFIKFVAKIILASYFVQKHVDEETEGFARDILNKSSNGALFTKEA